MNFNFEKPEYKITEYVENNNEVDIDKIEVHNNGTVCD